MVSKSHAFWCRWLVAVCVGVGAFGISMLLAPGLTRQLFGLLIYQSAGHLATFGDMPVAYITLTHGVLGAVMFGWSLALLFVVQGPFRRGTRDGWTTLAVSIGGWFVADTLFSLVTGFWQNAVFNVGFAVLFAIPLVATWSSCRNRST